MKDILIFLAVLAGAGILSYIGTVLFLCGVISISMPPISKTDEPEESEP